MRYEEFVWQKTEIALEAAPNAELYGNKNKMKSNEHTNLLS